MEEIPMKWYIICSLALYWIAGIKFYLLDRRFGVALQRKKYNLTHEEPLAAAEEFGFIHNRRFGVKMSWAAFVAASTSILLVLFAHTSPVIEIFTWVFDTTMVFFGFLFGPVAYRIWKGKERTLAALDDAHEAIRSGKLQQELKDGAADAVADLKASGGEIVDGVVDGVVDAANKAATAITGKPRFGDAGSKTSGSVTVPVVEPEPEETPEQLREKIAQFTRRKKP